MGRKRLLNLAPTVLCRWSVDLPDEVLTAADGSPALEYYERSTRILVPRRIAVHVHAVSDAHLACTKTTSCARPRAPWRARCVSVDRWTS
jgi:hypothetical protein